MKIIKLRAQNPDYLEEQINSYKRDFRVKEVTYIDSRFAFVEYEYRSYPDMIKTEKLNLSVRLYNCLTRNQIETLGEIKHFYLTGEIRRIRNLGNLCIKELAELLDKYYKSKDFTKIYESVIHNIDFNRKAKINVQFYYR